MEATTVMSMNHDCFAVSNCTFIWKITNFSNRCKSVGEKIESPIFTAGDIVSDKIKWKLKLYPFGDYKLIENYLSLYLTCILNDDVEECDVSFKCNLWNNNQIEIYQEAQSYKFTKKHTLRGYSNFILRYSEELKNHLLLSEKDTLSIACSIYNITPLYIDAGSNQDIELIRGFESLFLCEHSSDVSIQVDNRILKAHKIILSARSEVFSAMFKHLTVENITSIIKVTDVSYDVMKEVLRFIYCGKVRNVDLHKADLLAAANKYNLVLLKNSCEEAFWKRLSTDTVCDILSIADMYNCPKLKTGAIIFIIAHMKKVLETSEFFEFVESNPHSLIDFFRTITKS